MLIQSQQSPANTFFNSLNFLLKRGYARKGGIIIPVVVSEQRLTIQPHTETQSISNTLHMSHKGLVQAIMSQATA